MLQSPSFTIEFPQIVISSHDEVCFISDLDTVHGPPLKSRRFGYPFRLHFFILIISYKSI